MQKSIVRAKEGHTHTQTRIRACKQRSQCKWLGREWVTVCAKEWKRVRGGGWCGVCTHYSHNSRQAGSVGKCACSVKCFSKLLKIASKRNNNNVKVICAIVLCIVICPHTLNHTHTQTHTEKCYALPVAAAAVVIFVVFVVHGGMRAVSSSQKIIHMSPIAIPPPPFTTPLPATSPPHLPLPTRGARALSLSLPLFTSHYLSLQHTSQLWLMLCERN